MWGDVTALAWPRAASYLRRVKIATLSMMTALTTALTTMLTALTTMLACGAPRDPELEKQVLIARQEKARAPAEDEGSSPPAVSAPVGRPTKTYSGEEIAKLLGNAAISGQGTNLVAVVTTEQGVLTCTLDERAPQTVANFVGLASGQLEWQDAAGAPRKGAFYDGLTFHRVVHEFIIQTGNPTGKTNAGPGWRIAREQGANELFLQPGAMGMIEDGDATHGSQFFVTAKADKGLGNTYSAFGRCDAVDLVKAVSSAEKKAGDAKSPAQPVSITSIKVQRRP